MPTFSLQTQCAPMVENQEINSSNNTTVARQVPPACRTEAASGSKLLELACRKERNISIITTFAIMFVIKTPDCSYEWFMWIN